MVDTVVLFVHHRRLSAVCRQRPSPPPSFAAPSISHPETGEREREGERPLVSFHGERESGKGLSCSIGYRGIALLPSPLVVSAKRRMTAVLKVGFEVSWITQLSSSAMFTQPAIHTNGMLLTAQGASNDCFGTLLRFEVILISMNQIFIQIVIWSACWF